ncbi:MAG: ATP-binding cassette domain-containing protein [Nitriliruptorales bacterium]|nr:ATP-binding cassette domain-containing protein [Nitriliruptorales bacterium]
MAGDPPSPSVIVDDVSVTYQVYEDRKPTLRALVANGLRPRPRRLIEAVREVSLVAHPGEVIGVVGRNGSGKTSLLRAIAGLLPVVGGAVYARSCPVLLGVSAALQPQLSGRQNVRLGGTALGLSRREIQQRLDEIVAFAGLEEFIDVPLRAYSSGMAARLQFAIATAISPEVLLVDEVLGVGDQEFQRRGAQRIRELVEGRGTAFVVSHRPASIIELCSRAIWLERGRLVADGEPSEVVAAYGSVTGG